MKVNLDKLKHAIEALIIADDGRKILLQLLGQIEKGFKTLDFRLERALKDKNTLSTLLSRTSDDLEKSSELIQKMFGRYLSTEVMHSLLDDPSALELGGERRKVTIMMTDLRGFTALSERLKPEQVVQLLNSYFEVMVDVIFQYQGTINEIIGDSLLVIFGAPKEMPDRARRAIACAIEMQNAMAKVNEQNRGQGLPELEMGIGLNETEVIVGNIGSSKRSKYAVVGSGVNMTSRIESYTVGGQILISESVRRDVGEILRIDAQRDVLPKGAEKPLRVYDVGGIAGGYNLALASTEEALFTLARQIPIRYTVLEGKDVGMKELKGFVIRLSKNCAEVTLHNPISVLTNLKMNLESVGEKLSVRDFYGKVTKLSSENGASHVIRFTSIPPEIDAYFQAHLQHVVSI
ncbi:MAG: adenylate/guanylate cyclase domain-containing protein [Desulfomonilaceae bacterium]